MAKRTKIIATLGPAVDKEETLREAIEAGIDIVRLNFSHGSHGEHLARIDRVKRLREEMGLPIAILLDTQGPEIRTGLLKEGAPVALHAGDEIVLTDDDVLGTAECVSQSCAGLSRYVQPGAKILIDDGLLGLTVNDVRGGDIVCHIENDGELGQRKSINIPGVSVPLPPLTDKDKDDLLFGIENGIDFVAVSFVRNAEGVREVRRFLNNNGGDDVKVISKIECAEAVHDIEEIIQASDGVMVARGDLGVEVPSWRVPHIQKRIIRMCNEAYKPVITATQMLDSMIRNPRPTRAEVADVANAIYDGTDCVMLSGETAAGAWPVQAVETMARVAESSEPYLFEEGGVVKHEAATSLASLAVGRAAVRTAECLRAACIIAPTMTGRTARLISGFRPSMPIYSVTPFSHVMRGMQLYWGVTPLLGDAKGSIDHVIAASRDAVSAAGYVRRGDVAVITAGDPKTSPIIPGDDDVPVAAPTNVMHVVQIR